MNQNMNQGFGPHNAAAGESPAPGVPHAGPQPGPTDASATPPLPVRPALPPVPALPALPEGASRKQIVRVGGSRPPVQALPGFHVMLHDDEHVEMAYVVRTIVELTPLSAPLARDTMLAAHEHGSAAMLVTHLERAELYREQFTIKGLTVTLRAAE